MSAKQIRRLAKKEAKKLIMAPEIANIGNNYCSENLNETNDSCSSDSEIEKNEFNLSHDLGKWATQFGVSLVALNALLFLLRKCNITVPKDGRTILKTPCSVIQRQVQSVFVPQSDSVQSLLIELKSEIIALRNEVSGLKKEIKELKEGNTKNTTKLAEEIISVKLENRMHHEDPLNVDKLTAMQNLPFSAIDDLQKFDDEIQQNEDKLIQFKQYIANTGGGGHKEFIRAAIRKVFTDQVAAAYAWKGTITKPSAEKCFLVTTIKNICYAKFNTTDKDMNTVLQKHFVHANDRLLKRKRVE